MRHPSAEGFAGGVDQDDASSSPCPLELAQRCLRQAGARTVASSSSLVAMCWQASAIPAKGR
eukprot:2756117-Prorocentrum_lima.AAC.1